MNKFKLVVLLLLTTSRITYADKKMTDSNESIQTEDHATSHQLSGVQRYIIDAMVHKRSFNPSSDLTGNLQTLTNNRIKIILQKMRFQQVELLAALSKNNDLLIQSLNDPNDQQNARALLVMSKEILSFITALSSYTTQATSQINQ
ncbi:MAG: hypothetical protein Q8Q60_02910 [Candidatus Chromulinivorax sp.]|nr:hypothetical protein [Candidatus Chromulinivorax sp.]